MTILMRSPMRRQYAPTRLSTRSVSATTLIALVAMAAGAPALGAVASVRHARHVRLIAVEAVAPLGESEAVRAVAAVMAAAARDFLSGQCADAVLPAGSVLGAFAPAPAIVCRVAADTRPRGGEPLDERMLDLPPPV